MPPLYIELNIAPEGQPEYWQRISALGPEDGPDTLTDEAEHKVYIFGVDKAADRAYIDVREDQPEADRRVISGHLGMTTFAKLGDTESTAIELLLEGQENPVTVKFTYVSERPAQSGQTYIEI